MKLNIQEHITTQLGIVEDCCHYVSCTLSYKTPTGVNIQCSQRLFNVSTSTLQWEGFRVIYVDNNAYFISKH